MKKSMIWTIVAGLVIILGGGYFLAHQKSNNHQVDAAYQQALTSGKEAAKAKNYAQASRKFDNALGIKNTAEAVAYKNQANDLLTAIKAAKSSKYTQALRQIDRAIDQPKGYPVMTRQARSLKTTVSNVQDNYEHEIKPLLTTARQTEKAKQYNKASEEYQKILDLPYIGEEYYTQYQKAAHNGLMTSRKAAQAQTPNSGESSYGTIARSSKSKRGDTGNAGKTGAGKMGDHTVHGQTVTSDQILQLRKRVQKLGYEGMAWSPQDLIDLYRDSKRSTPAKITKKDIQNYLKP